MKSDEPLLPPEAYSRMALVLRVGLALALVIIIVSLAAYVSRYPSITPGQLVSNNPIVGYLTPSGLLQGLLTLHTEAFMTLGVIVLAATPVARVFSGMWYFRKVGDRPLTWLALTVLILLLVGFFVIGPLVR